MFKKLRSKKIKEKMLEVLLFVSEMFTKIYILPWARIGKKVLFLFHIEIIQ